MGAASSRSTARARGSRAEVSRHALALGVGAVACLAVMAPPTHASSAAVPWGAAASVSGPAVPRGAAASVSGRARPGTSRVLAWLAPPPVLPLPSRSGLEGPPRPFGASPPPGPAAPPTSPALVRAQNRALLYGPFPRGGLARGVSDPTLIMNPSAAVRAAALARIKATGASIVRIPVEWRYIVSDDPPAGFEASDPASPAYDFTTVDAAVRDSVAAGLQPLLVLTRAPAFAEAPHRWPYAYPGSWDPNPAAFGEFATAVARRYAGAFPDPLVPGRVLPRVHLFEAWNEPNLARYLEPQWVASGGRWVAFSPLVYRALLNALSLAVKSVQPGATVIAAGVAPNGEPAGVGRMTPLRFLRGLLCLAGRTGHREGGSGRGACADPPRFDVLAFHPLSFESPDRPAASSQDVAIADIAKVTTLLARAVRAGTALPRAHKPLWVTELNWESAPPAPHGVPASLQALWVSRALHRLWVAGVQFAEWQFLDDPASGVTLATPTGGTVQVPRPAGLYGPGVLAGQPDPALARPKPFLTGFTLPFDPLRVDRQHVRVWALLMRPRQSVLLQRLTPGLGWVTIAALRANGQAVVNRLLALRGAMQLRIVSGTLSSASASVGRRAAD